VANGDDFCHFLPALDCTQGIDKKGLGVCIVGGFYSFVLHQIGNSLFLRNYDLRVGQSGTCYSRNRFFVSRSCCVGTGSLCFVSVPRMIPNRVATVLGFFLWGSAVS
jgi:hypothetical protein